MINGLFMIQSPKCKQMKAAVSPSDYGDCGDVGDYGDSRGFPLRAFVSFVVNVFGFPMSRSPDSLSLDFLLHLFRLKTHLAHVAHRHL